MSLPDPSYAWRPAPLVWFALCVLAACALAVLWRPALWPWALVALAADFLVVTAAVFRPRSQLLGPNLTRLPSARNIVSLTFDDGPHPQVTPHVLDLLDRHGAKASFFCVAERAAAHPELVKEILRRGHGVENHSLRHSNAFAFYGLVRLRRDVESAQSILGGIAGKRPSFFRAPIGLRSPFLDPVLARCGLRYVSWTRRGFDGIDTDAARVLRRLVAGLAPGDILLLHDSRPVVLAVLPQLLEQLTARNLASVALADGFA